jgi:hypothetical protein
LNPEPQGIYRFDTWHILHLFAYEGDCIYRHIMKV